MKNNIRIAFLFSIYYIFPLFCYSLFADNLINKIPEAVWNYTEQADLLSKKGDYKKSIIFFEKAYQIQRDAIGEDNIYNAILTKNIANNYSLSGDYKSAENYYEKTYRNFLKSLGPSDKYTIESFGLLIDCYLKQGRIDDAIPLLFKLLNLEKEHYGINSIEAANTLHSIGWAFQKKGEYSKAISSFENALLIKKATLGKSSPSTIMTYNCLANSFSSQGDNIKAKDIFSDVLITTKSKLGINHLATAETLNNLALVHIALGEHFKSIPLLEESINIRLKLLGQNHPDTAQSFANIGSVYFEMGDFVKALKSWATARDIYEKNEILHSSDYATVLDNIASLSEDYLSAIKLRETALNIWENILGPNHPEVARGLNNLASIYSITGNHDKAIEMHQKALNIRIKSLGETHALTGRSYNRIANCYQDIGDYQKSFEFYEKAFDIFSRLGNNHPYAINCAKEFSENLYCNNDNLNATKYACLYVNGLLSQFNNILTLDENSRLNWQAQNISYWHSSLLVSSLLS